MFNFVAEYTNYTITELEHRSYEEFFRILDHAESIVDARNKAMEPQGD